MNSSKLSAAGRNKEPILEVLKQYITENGRLLEVGTGNGIHAAYFAESFPKLHWVTSEIKENCANIQKLLKNKKLPNIHGPEVLKVGESDFPPNPFDYLFTANTLHIMSWKENKALFKLAGKRLRAGSIFFIYGPFNYGGEYTSKSNEEFDAYLKTRNPQSGIRNFEDVLQSMTKFGFKLLKDHEMPVNNRLLVFERLIFSEK